MTTDSPDLESAADDPRKAALKRAIAIADGQTQLAGMIGTTQSQIWYWLEKSKKGVPGEFCLRIEDKTGVPKHELRPDVFPPPQIVEPAP